MTYCVGWQTEAAAFLVADAAVTKAELPRQAYSTFGELHPVEREYSVEESALKIYRWPTLGLTCAGSPSSIQQFAHEVDRQLRQGKSDFDALVAARNHINASATFEGIAALIWESRPQLFRLKKDGSWNAVERKHAVHLGSPWGRFKQFVQDAIIEVVEDNMSPSSQLACVMAACQSLTVHEYLLAEKAGGVFSGLQLDNHGARWQPDLGYLLVDPADMTKIQDAERIATNSPYITCCFRNDVLFVKSPLARGITAPLSTKEPTTTAQMIDQINLGLKSAYAARISCCLDYMILMSRQRPIVAVIEMKKRNRSGHLRMTLSWNRDGKELVSSEMSPMLGDRIQGIGVEDGLPRMVYCSA